MDYEGAAKAWIDGLWDKLGGAPANGAPSTGSASSEKTDQRAGLVLGEPDALSRGVYFRIELDGRRGTRLLRGTSG